MSRMIGKITPSTCGCNPELAKIEKREVNLLRLYGYITGTKAVTMGEGERKGETFIGLTGSIEAVSLETGEIFKSGIAYFPSGLHDHFINLLAARENESDVIDFAFDLYAYPAGNPRGYSYGGRLLQELEGPNDPIRKLRESLPPLPPLRKDQLAIAEKK